MRHHRTGDDAFAPDMALHDDWLAQERGHLLTDNAREQVAWSAGSECRHKGDRLSRESCAATPNPKAVGNARVQTSASFLSIRSSLLVSA